MIKYASLCSGIGTETFSFKRLGIPSKCVLWSDNDKFAQQTHNLNHPEYKDKLHPDLKTIGWERVEDFDFLLSGFPCQPFSLAGSRGGFEDTRGTIFFHLAKALSIKKPEYFLFENVTGLMSHDSGRTYRTIINVLEELGYYVWGRVYNTTQFGIPHNRPRIWLIGFKDYTKHLNYKTIAPMTPIRDLSTFLDSSVGSKYDISEASWKRMQPTISKKGHKMKPNKLYVIDYGASQRYQTLSEGIVPCLKATRSNYVVLPLKRHLTPRECFRLQGFYDDELKCDVSDTQAYKQAGNGWTVTVSTEIIRRMLGVEDDMNEKV